MKRTVFAHPSVVIIESPQKKLLMSVYDGGYPVSTVCRYAANLMGGNPNAATLSPRDTIQREIREEIDPKYKNWNEKNWAPKEDIKTIRDAVLDNIEPLADFFIHAMHVKRDNSVKWYDALFSVYQSKVSDDIIHGVEFNLINRKSIVNEGLAGIFTLDILENRGIYGTAHGTPLILNDRFGAKIPVPEGVYAEKLSTPIRERFEDYLDEFEYLESFRKH
jgi:hypothetical protein